MSHSKQVSRALLFGLALAVPASGCAGRKAAWEQDSEAPTKNTDAAAATDHVAAGDAAWEQRTSADKIRAAIASWEKAAEADRSNTELLVKLTRAHYFLADGFLRDDKDAYLKTMDRGVYWGELAIMAASPEFKKQMAEGAKFHEAVAVVGKEGVPAMYWYASSLGKWAKKTGFAVLLGQKDNVRALMDKCMALDPEYYYAGPWRYFGVFYAVAPSFAGGDLEKSKTHFAKSLELEPRYVGTKVLWAAELSTKTQDEDTFVKLLNEVLETPDDVIPELQPEIIVEKAKAKELLEQKDELF